MNAKSSSSVHEAIRVLRMEAQAIERCAANLEQDPARGRSYQWSVDAIRGALDHGGKIIVTGLGKSGKVAQKIAATFCSTGSFAVYLHPTEGLHGDLGIAAPEDIVVAMSQTGNTDEIVSLIPSLKKLKIQVIAMTGNPRSRLAMSSDFVIDTSVEQEACPHNLAPTTSTTLMLALGDSIAVSLMQLRGFDVEAFAKNHPGGAIGRRLNLTVGDVMHSGDQVATVTADATMDVVIAESTQKKLGAVLVVEGKRLLGIITDGDLRRALSHRERFFKLRAHEIMTKRPVTVAIDAPAPKALELMENRTTQISVLPVVSDATGSEPEWVGVIRLHDLVQSL